MVLLVLGRVIRVDRVRLVNAEDERLPHRRGVEFGIAAAPVLSEGVCYPIHGIGHHRGPSALRAAAPDLLVVEAGYQRDHVVLDEVLTPAVFQDGFQRNVHCGQIVQPGAVQEFALDAAQAGCLTIEQSQFEVADLLRLDAQFGRNQVHQRRLLSFIPRVSILSRMIELFRDSRLQQGLRPDDGAEMLFFVHFECAAFFRRLEVDAKGRHSSDRFVDADDLLFDFLFLRLWINLPDQNPAGDS
mmetsp:Transcript_42412/g.90238  ORF Transcript_42412/g.90238 Transcript_42412/m.90238 type:complete len:243 (-) Transcript_42412:310-1038(-)